MINIWYIDKTAQKNADDYLSFYPTAINLSILDFKRYLNLDEIVKDTSINLSILDFKHKKSIQKNSNKEAINLSILDFKQAAY